MPLYRTPLIDTASAIVFLEGRYAGCATPYFQRTLLGISQSADDGAGVAPDVSGKVDAGTSGGWSAPTGTSSKAAFATYAAPSAGAGYSQAQMQAVMDHLQVLSQHLKAVEEAGFSSGLLTT